jgi:hypothetical protein
MRARVALGCRVAVEALDQQDILAGDGLDAAFGCREAALARKPQHGVLDTRVVPAVVAAAEFGHP